MSGDSDVPAPPPSHRYRWGLPRRLSYILIAIMFAGAYPGDFHIDIYCIMVAGARPGIIVVCGFNISFLYASCCLAQVASFLYASCSLRLFCTMAQELPPQHTVSFEKATFLQAVWEETQAGMDAWCKAKQLEAEALSDEIDASFHDGMHRDESDMAADKACQGSSG